LAARAKDVVDLPDRRLADLLVLIHQSNGTSRTTSGNNASKNSPTEKSLR